MYNFSKIYIILYILFIYICVQSLSITLDKGLRKNNDKTDREIGKQTKWNGSTSYKIEKGKQTW